MKAKGRIGFILGGLLLFSFPFHAYAQGESKPEPAQVARGAQAWADHCSRCHNLRSPSELTDEGWMVSTAHMRVRANLPGGMIEDIVAFLKASNKEER